jgi:DMSO/TMAO reductase YedYZ molybdopterin-dependent catalytic subunit
MAMDRRIERGLTGAITTGAWLLGLVGAGALVGQFPIIPVADAMVTAAPGGLATFAIDTFGKLALWLAVARVSGVALLIGVGFALAGISVRWALPEAGVVSALLLFLSGGGPLAVALGTIIALAPPAAVAWVVSGTSRTASHPGRRAVLRAGATGVAAGAVAGAAGRLAGGTLGGDASAGASEPIARKSDGRAEPTTTTRTTGEGAFGFGFGEMPPAVNDIEDQYVIDKNASDPTVDGTEWTLDIGGAVAEPTSYTVEELLDHEECANRVVTMACISNTVGGNLIGTPEWIALPLDALLDDAGVEAAAVDVVTRATDGYHEAMPVETVREQDVFLAVGATGETLSVTHGWPARLLVPGRYGMKSTKWVDQIELSTEEHDAFWESRGWDEEAVVNTLSYVRGSEVRGDRTAVGGVAYGGNRGIQRVEVSIDGGTTWTDAELEDPPGEFAWRRWRHVFDTPDRDSAEAVVRATDGTGTRQTRETSSPHPGGSTGWHRKVLYF